MKNVLMFSVITLFLVFLSACSQTPEEKFEKAVLKFNKKGDEKSRLYIYNYFLSECCAVEVEDAEDYIPGTNSIILKKDGTSRVITSDGFSEPWSDEVQYSHYDPLTKTICISDGFKADFFKFSLTDEGKQHIYRLNSIEITNDGKSPIHMMYMHNDYLVYLYKDKLYRLDIDLYKSTPLLSSYTFTAPYTKMDYKVTMDIEDNFLAICIGDGGSYNLSLFDISSEKKIIFNKKIMSNFFFVDNKGVSYLEKNGSSWNLVHQDGTSEKKNVKSFTNLKDITKSGDTIFYINDSGLHIEDTHFASTYSENGLFTIKKLLNNYILIADNSKKYLVHTTLYFDNYSKFKTLVPVFFEETLTSDDLDK